jgi:L-threonylcarbamoyladenylate synthase
VSTDLIEVDPQFPSADAIQRASVVIRSGGVVAIPTDALYMLVADPFNLAAVGRVFAAKGRESTRSLPLLVSDMLMVEDLTTEITVRFQVLARRFWPGPLTIIVPASSKVPLKLTGNTGRLALRQSRGVVANALLEHMGMPLIGTSANMSGVPTCRSGIEVFGTMDGRVDLVLDGGHCVGEGASTIDITEPYWRMIKQGAVEEREIAEVLRGN